MIKIQNLNKKYSNSVIFENTSFSFPDNGLVCILGPSGCGKSTLLNLIAGFDSSYDGSIVVQERNLAQMNAQELCAYRRDNIGFVFQNYHLLSGYTAKENVMLATDVAGKSQAVSENEIMELFEKLGLLEKAEQKAETLSGGQKQRVAIARALVNHPSIILADEPTGALDRKNSDEIMELLRTLAKNRLVIVITHDKKCAEYADQIVTISDGKLVCEQENTDKSSKIAASDLKETKTVNASKLSLWKRAFKNLKVHLARYIAVALAVSLGVLCFTLSLSSGNIMEQSIADFEKKNTAYHNGYIKAEGNEDELIQILSNDARIENIYAQYVLNDISIKMGEQTVDMDEKYPMSKTAEKMSYGVMPRRGENEIAMNPSLAAKFDRNIQNLIGKTVELKYNDQTYEVRVSGIFNATFDDYFVSSDIEQKMYEGMDKEAYAVSYDVIEFEDIVAVNEGLEKQGIQSQNASAEVAVFLNTFKNLNRLFMTVSILIFVIGVLISAILLVKQQNTRYREVGLLAALGYTKGNIQKILLYENIGLAAISAGCTTILTVLALIISKAVGFAVVFTIPQVVFAIILTAFLIMVISFISSIRLICTEPAAALRK